MAKGSMYTNDYLNYNEGREDKPITPGTFLSRQLRGKASKYKMRYLDVLIRDLESLNNVKKVKSAGNGIAWIRI